jgi:hypothetical protein
MSTGITISAVLIAVAIGAWAWWKLFNTPNGERYLKMRTQGPFVSIVEDSGQKNGDTAN